MAKPSPSLSPLYWLAADLAAAGLYVMYLVASHNKGEWQVSAQLNSVILTALSVGAVLSFNAEIERRRDRSRSAEMAVHATWIRAQLVGVRRELASLRQEMAPTEPIQRLHAVGTAIVQRAAEMAYDDGFVDGLVTRPTATVTKIDGKRSS